MQVLWKTRPTFVIIFCLAWWSAFLISSNFLFLNSHTNISESQWLKAEDIKPTIEYKNRKAEIWSRKLWRIEKVALALHRVKKNKFGCKVQNNVYYTVQTWVYTVYTWQKNSFLPKNNKNSRTEGGNVTNGNGALTNTP